MKSLFLLLILVLTVACSEQKAPQPAAKPAAVADNEENRQAAAKHYLEAVPPKELLMQMSERVVKMLPEKSQKTFLEVMNSQSMQDATYRISLDGLVKHFTVNEINALTAFYGSPEGKSISKKFPEYMAEAMPKINQEVIAALQKVKDQEEPKAPQGQMQPPATKAPHGQMKPAGPKEPQAQTKPGEPQAPPAPPETAAPPAPKAPPAPPSAK
jgi:hypothetical protein